MTQLPRIPHLTAVATAALLALGASGCSTQPRKLPASADAAPTPASQTTTKPPSLSRETAAIRARQITKVSYVLWFGLDASHEDFQGRTVLNFELKDKARSASSEIPIDFWQGSLRSVSINGTAMAPEQISDRYDGRQLKLKVSELHSGANRIEIAYSHAFSTAGNGLHRFKDPADNRVYLYTDLEPYNANRVFPCFDQPDLKASYELTAEVPDDWSVIANTPERDVSTVDGRKSWQFPPSPAFSTYVFALHAGPYAQWKSDASGIPLRLFARQSLKEHVDAPEWFEVTRQGLDFYGVRFGYPYPYAKYDQVIVPEFNSGAMENVAAVTFSEDHVFRGRVTEDRRRGRADTILHEMAHMWFGDLVTMRWWNGLWLNESFATFAAAWSLDEATRFGRAQPRAGAAQAEGAEPAPEATAAAASKSAALRSSGSRVWQSFFTGMKEWAYLEDQLVTTHPIETSVPDTQQAFANFDGITYGKGAAVLKQLRYFVGEDEFQDGLQRYFLKHAFRNTALADFMRSLSEASGVELASWQKAWLQTSGVNTVQVQFTCGIPPKPETPPEETTGRHKRRRARRDPEGPVIQSFQLIQKPSPGTSLLRPHKTQVALYGSDLQPSELLDVEYSGANTSVDSALGKPCPAMVFPNYGDQDYVKVLLDPASLDVTRKSLGRISDPFIRQMLWHTLWEMVRDAQLSPADYAGIALTQLSGERDTQVLSRVLQTLARPSERASVLHYLPADARGAMASKLEEFTLRGMRASPAGSDAQLVWMKAWLALPLSSAGQELALGWLDGRKVPAGMKIDQERRWEIIDQLARSGNSQARPRIAAELDHDATDQGNREAIAAGASIPDAQAKSLWWDRLIDPGAKFTDSQLREALEHLFPLGQEDLARPRIDAWLQALPRVAAARESEYGAEFAQGLFPALCDAAVDDHVEAFLKASGKSLTAAMVKAIRIEIQEDRRCVGVRVRN